MIESWNEFNFEAQLETKKCAHCSEAMDPMKSYSIRIPDSQTYKYVCSPCWITWGETLKAAITRR